MLASRHGWCVFPMALLAACGVAVPVAHAQRKPAGPEAGLPAPIAIYTHANDTHASGPDADTTAPLDEALALRELDQLARLKRSGLRIDYDLLDAYAIAPDGLHAFGRSAAWPDGPDAWIARCRAAGIRPGLRFSNSALRPDGQAPEFFEAEILHVFMPALQSWYNRGIRLFVFDGLDLTAAAPEGTAGATADEPAARNAAAFRAALATFRAKNRGARLLAMESDAGARHAESSFGGFVLFGVRAPRFPMMPQTNLQRAIDIETDAQVRGDEQAGVSLAQIFSTGFVAAPAAAAEANAPELRRGWRGAFLLSMARGGWVNALSGNLESTQAADARWMARVQKLFFEVQAQNQMNSFGGSPFGGQPYGFAGAAPRGAVDVVVNPTQAVATLPLSALASDRPPGPGRVLFRDAGFSPRLIGNAITLGPGQMAVVGFGAFAAPEFNFGIEQDVVIPRSIEPVDADFHVTDPGILEARIDPPIRGVLRIVVRERAHDGTETSAAAGAHTADSGNRCTLDFTQAGRPIPLRPAGAEGDGDSTLSAGLSWAVAEIDVNDLTPGIPLRVRFRCNDDAQAVLEGSAYQVIY